MKLHVLTNTFALNYVIDEYVSLIWTERYTSAGDVKFVTIPHKFYIDSLVPGTFVSIPDSKEVMIIETQVIENGLLKISGSSLLSVLNYRYVWEPDTASTASTTPPMDYKSSEFAPGHFIAQVVYRFAIWIPPFPAGKRGQDLDAEEERIPNLSVKSIDYSGVDEELTAPLGPIHAAIKPIAETYNVGMSLYLDFANTDGSYSLGFKTYKGKDRTSNQTANSRMRLSSTFDEISDVKELRSNVEEINSIYVYTNDSMVRFGVRDADGKVVDGQFMDPAPGLGRRVKILHPAIISEQYEKPRNTYSYMTEVAKYYLTQYKPTHIVDAQILSLINYKFGIDYGLGDIIEYESAITGAISKARVTEYIRSHDSSGEKAYPTIVIE